jgi:hypothetical protein
MVSGGLLKDVVKSFCAMPDKDNTKLKKNSILIGISTVFTTARIDIFDYYSKIAIQFQIAVMHCDASRLPISTTSILTI